MGLKDHRTLEEINTQVVHQFSKTLEMFGLTPSEARLFVTLYIHREPMTLDEMSEAMEKSKTSMSTGIRSLLDQGLVERVWKKGFRKDYFKAEDNLYKSFMTAYIQKWLDATNQQQTALDLLEKQLEKEDQSTRKTSEKADKLFEKIEHMKHFHQLIFKAFEDLEPNK
ncbi:transcriptional regulator [Halobacillus salinarum]|uniref:HTH-type transcriptional regulator n=1 Tax=Halobacillus salinarum TaxID=2932257 RepID=A0ABY4EGB0_9BACI|nr:helix-turn-helix domain-containing protein [Halobacillus salinarum]UOQ43508.1 transcriptional regulator [Halobacillus salinarum]